MFQNQRFTPQSHTKVRPAYHLEFKTVELTMDFRGTTPPSFTILSNAVSTADHFWVLGTTRSQDLSWSSHIDTFRKMAQQTLYFLQQLKKYNLRQELMVIFYTVIIQSVLFASISVWFGSYTNMSNYNEQSGLQRGSSMLTFPPSRTCTGLASQKRQPVSLQTPHILDINGLDFYLQVDGSERQLKKPATTDTVSSPRLSLSDEHNEHLTA
ncbi:uncharacterized protein LOC124883284 [Girardinichthys multiradiatus]|uniref:uncharacterized protein LOC124883284 n=1 Tax=Girardinichthys multiradiatus TaxID=208333 RepID=UPI001FADF40C|nr:uncharacterized protein LOC124883284 [Girardinichthys multiradiatus]